MLNKLKALRNQAGEEGFTLIELLVVIIIIGILSAIALPLFFQQQEQGVKASVKSDVRNTVTEIATLLVDEPTADAAELGAVVPVETEGNTVTVTGDWKTYVVTGSNVDVAGWSYVFTASNGQYTEGGAVVVTP